MYKFVLALRSKNKVFVNFIFKLSYYFEKKIDLPHSPR